LSKKNSVARVFVAGDWDADGVIAAALILYAQERLGKYPLESKAIVTLKPLDPERFKFLAKEFKANYDAAVFLDIPYYPGMEKALSLLKKHFGVKRIVFVDHHISSINYKKSLEEHVDELYVGQEPTAMIVYRVLEDRGITIFRRLKTFVETVTYMDRGARVPSSYMKMFELVSLFSKALTVKRNEEIWIKLVRWLANPMPVPMPLDRNILEKVKEAVRKRDEELKNVATDLALTARKVGYIKFVDARNVWKKRGATALASKIAHILKSPVAVLFRTNKNYMLLIIKAPRGGAYRVAKYLLGEGYAEDIAGHPNLAIVRVPESTDINDLLKALQKASLYM